MKKVLLGLVAVFAIGIVLIGLNNNTERQPAAAVKAVPVVVDPKNTTSVTLPPAPTTDERKKPDRRGCKENADGSIDIWWETWSGWWIFGSWHEGPHTTVPQGQHQGCEGWTNGYVKTTAPTTPTPVPTTKK